MFYQASVIEPDVFTVIHDFNEEGDYIGIVKAFPESADRAHSQAEAHGGVVADGDLCIIGISYLQAHFKIYQPLIDGHEEFCEDLPNATESVFVMEYMHDELARVPIEFRIIHDVTGKGRFANWYILKCACR